MTVENYTASGEDAMRLCWRGTTRRAGRASGEQKAVMAPMLREILGLVWREATPFIKGRLAALLVLVAAGGVLTALSPVALRVIIDRLSAQPGRSATPVLLGAVYVLTLWLARGANVIRELVFARAEQRIYRTLSERLFSHVMHLPLRFHLDRQTGGVSQTLDNGLEGLRLILYHLVFTYVPVAVELIEVA